MVKKVYLPAATVSAQRLEEAYQSLENHAIIQAADDEDERPVKDPFGLKKRSKTTRIPFRNAQEAASRITKLMGVIGLEFGLKNEELIYAIELAALNAFNAQDCPLSAEQIDVVRQKAYEYYQQSIRQLNKRSNKPG